MVNPHYGLGMLTTLKKYLYLYQLPGYKGAMALQANLSNLLFFG